MKTIKATTMVKFFAMLLISQQSLATCSDTNTIAIDKLPFIINTPGSYCLTTTKLPPLGQYNGYYEPIRITSDEVTLDLNGYTLTNTDMTWGTWGIYSAQSP